LIKINFGDDEMTALEAAHDSWESSAVAGGYDSDFSYDYTNDCGGPA